MFVDHVVMESCVTHGKARKLSCVWILVCASLDGSINETLLQQLVVEVSCMTTQVTDEVANFGSHACIRMSDQHFEWSVQVSMVDGLIDLLVDSGQLTDQTE